jgi:hypothetical protein
MTSTKHDAHYDNDTAAIVSGDYATHEALNHITSAKSLMLKTPVIFGGEADRIHKALAALREAEEQVSAVRTLVLNDAREARYCMIGMDR